MVYTAEKSLKDHEKEVPAEIKTEIEEKIKLVREAKDKDDKSAIESATEALTTSLQKIGEIMQKAAEAASKPAEEPSSEEPKVHDADATDVDGK
jgi:molecular chaperone DnaK